MMKQVLVKRDALSETRIDERDLSPLANGAVRLDIESFSVTANNITYAVIGEAFGYWKFFPAPEGWGIVPMWGHAKVTASNHPDIAVGERLYGYLPMADTLDIVPGKVSAGGLVDTAEHRQPMSPIYNQYSRLSADPEHDPAKEAERMLFGPLFKTGFLIEAMFRRENWFGASMVVMTSASSKTAMGLASVAKNLSPGVTRVGLTSAGNVDFVAKSGLYDRVLTYDDIGSLAAEPTVAVDFAGNSDVLRRIHEQLGTQLSYSCLVGATHVDARGLGGGGAPIPGPKPVLFFAPDHAVASVKELGPKGFGEAVAAQWGDFLHSVAGVVAVDTRHGLNAAADAYVATLKGTADPQKGIIIHP